MSILDGVQRVLSLYAEGAAELSFTDVATRLSLPKSTTSRLLNQMQRHGLLDQDASSRRYRPGLMLSMAARAGMAGRPLDSACRKVLARLSERSGLTAYLSTLNQRETVVLQRLDGSHPVQVLSPPGSRRAASGTAMGRALLSRLSDAEFTDLYGANPVLHLPMEGRDCPGSVGELAERGPDARRALRRGDRPGHAWHRRRGGRRARSAFRRTARPVPVVRVVPGRCRARGATARGGAGTGRRAGP